MIPQRNQALYKNSWEETIIYASWNLQELITPSKFREKTSSQLILSSQEWLWVDTEYGETHGVQNVWNKETHRVQKFEISLILI